MRSWQSWMSRSLAVTSSTNAALSWVSDRLRWRPPCKTARSASTSARAFIRSLWERSCLQCSTENSPRRQGDRDMGWKFPMGREEKRQVLLAAVERVQDTLLARADEAEANATLPLATVQALDDAGLFAL